MNFLSKRHLSRRTVLRGLGAAVSLPLLDSMVPAQTPLAKTAAKPQVRLGLCFIPHGAVMANWTPIGEGANFEISRTLKPLEPYLRGAPPGLPFEWSAKTLKSGLNFTLVTTAGSLDLLGEIVGGGTYQNLHAHASRMRIFGRDVLVLDLDALIKAKRAAGRPKDFDAIAELELLRDLDTGEKPAGQPQKKPKRRK